MARSEKHVTLARRASEGEQHRKSCKCSPSLARFEVACLGRKGETFWPKAYPHRSLGNRPRKVLRIGIVWPKAIFTEDLRHHRAGEYGLRP